MSKIVSNKVQTIVDTVSKLKIMESRLITQIERDYSLLIDSFAERLSLNDVISLMDLDLFSEDLAKKVNLDVEKLKKMNSYNLKPAFMYGNILSADIGRNELYLLYGPKIINTFSGKNVSGLYDEITAKTEIAISKGQDDLPF